MITLINSMTYGAGTTTLTYFLAKTRSSLLNKPALIVSTQDDRPYRHMLPVSKDWENPSIKSVLTKLQTYADVRTFCYKVDSNLYYLNIEGLDIRTLDGQRLFLEFLKGVDHSDVHDGFESVWVDIDNYSGGFLPFVDDVDLVLVPVPPNVVKLSSVAESMAKLRKIHVKEFGMQLKTPIYYCVQQYCNQVPLNTIKKLLGVPDKYLLPFGYDVNIQKSFNNGKLSFYINEMLADPLTTESKTINSHTKRILKELKPQKRRGV